MPRVFGDFLGGMVEPGSHIVHFHFNPTSLFVGKWISSAAILIWLLMSCLRRVATN
ncbi:MAG: hypothetical protein ACWGMZ_01975 [Thermoguttaceae bacterium]